jgi:hypothetical protein
MECPPDIADSLLRKWRDEHAVLSVILHGSGFTSSSGGSITAFDLDLGIEIWALAMREPSGEVVAAPGRLLVSFEEGVSFEFTDPLEAPENVKDEAGSLFSSIIKINLPNGVQLVLSEMLKQPEHAPDS